MKHSLLAYVLLMLQFLSGCVGQHHLARLPACTPTELETISYSWAACGVEVSFHRSGPSRYWYMTVRDSRDVLEQSLHDDGAKWDVDASRCSRDEVLRIIDLSLARFSALRPDAKLESVNIEMQLISELWRDVLNGLAAAMARSIGNKDSTCREGPPDLIHGVLRTLNGSPTIGEVRRILLEHNLQVEYVGASEQILFKDSLGGTSWAEIATQRDLGVLAPGVVEFGLKVRQ